MSSAVFSEFSRCWLPHATQSGVQRILHLLEQGSPMLIHGTFAKSCALGCLATHMAWHHPETSHLQEEAGIRWLTRVAKLNPATSSVILAWDRGGMADWELRTQLIRACREELEARENDYRDQIDEEEEGSAELCWS